MLDRLGYATGLDPAAKNGEAGRRITFAEMYWKNCNNPKRGGAFFSPWFGIETTDNLNLIQPVNPWVGNSWEIYNEYFQWSPTNNKNSASHTVQPGDVLYGSVTFDEKTNSYDVFHKDLTDGWSVHTNIPVQRAASAVNDDGGRRLWSPSPHKGAYKNYTIVYVVFEKVAQCDQYPPDDEVTFYNITVERDGVPVETAWSTDFVDDNCDNRAHIVDANTVKFTWDSTDNSKGPKAGHTSLHGAARAAPGQVAASGDYCKSTEYCCPDAKHCLTPTKTSCAKDASVCSADQTCCPLTKLCVTVGAPCASPCKEGNTYCPSRSFTEHLIATKG